MKFRYHRGSLYESMKTTVEVDGFLGLLHLLEEHMQQNQAAWRGRPDGRVPISETTVHMRPYGFDDRIGWDTHLVTIDNWGVIGMTDGPC